MECADRPQQPDGRVRAVHVLGVRGAARRLPQQSGSDPDPSNWDAWTWANHARAEGLSVTTGSPQVGDIAVWSQQQVANTTGHVDEASTLQFIHQGGAPRSAAPTGTSSPRRVATRRTPALRVERAHVRSHAVSVFVLITRGAGRLSGEAVSGARRVPLRASGRGERRTLTVSLQSGRWRLVIHFAGGSGWRNQNLTDTIRVR